MKFLPASLAFLFLLLLGCSHKEYRQEAQKEYEVEEVKNQKKALVRADYLSEIGALSSQLQSLQQQINVQKNVIKEYEEDQDSLPSARMMMDNAKMRIKNLEKEKKEIEKKLSLAQKNLSELNSESN